MSSEATFEVYLITSRDDQRAWGCCRARVDEGCNVEVVLLHDAVLETEASIAVAWGGDAPAPVTVLACAEDATRRKVEERWALIDYAGVIEHCSNAAKVISW